jgi:hypothetical protein
VDEPQGAEGIDAAIAIGESGSGGNTSGSGGNRCGQQRPLRGRTDGPGPGTGPSVWVFYIGLTPSRGPVKELQSGDGHPAVYWSVLDPIYEILEEHGFEVYMVNARRTKNLPGRKSDVQESQWLLKLHT